MCVAGEVMQISDHCQYILGTSCFDHSNAACIVCLVRSNVLNTLHPPQKRMTSEYTIRLYRQRQN